MRERKSLIKKFARSEEAGAMVEERILIFTSFVVKQKTALFIAHNTLMLLKV